jgi:phenylalanyl-tRNA synthetase beta chain
MGILAPGALAATGLEGLWVAAELALPSLYDTFPPDREATSLPAFPAIDRDLTIVVGDDVTWSTIETAVDRRAVAGLESLDYVGTYRGPGVPEGHRSLTLRLRFRRADRTLVHEEVDPLVAAVVDRLRQTAGAELRS